MKLIKKQNHLFFSSQNYKNYLTTKRPLQVTKKFFKNIVISKNKCSII